MEQINKIRQLLFEMQFHGFNVIDKEDAKLLIKYCKIFANKSFVDKGNNVKLLHLKFKNTIFILEIVKFLYTNKKSYTIYEKQRRVL